jgi:galactose mutarotase-like enzyme
MRTEITNGTLTFAAESRGAEPWVLKFNGDDINYIWRPSPDKSGGTPICFPLLGAVPGGVYRLDGKEYPMGMHGFAQSHDFRMAEQTGSSLLYEISDTPKTLAQYPYRFRFQVLYALEDSSLKTEYRVKNCDDRELYFSVGGHPRFSCPIGGPDAGKFSDYVLEFAEPEAPENIIKSYIPRGEITRFMGDGGRFIALDYSIFGKGAFCFKRRPDRVVTLKRPSCSRALRMRIEGSAWLQLWTAAGEPFIALEPWYGSITRIPHTDEDGDWKKRPGTLSIAPGEEYRAVHWVSISKEGFPFTAPRSTGYYSGPAQAY